MKQHSKGHSTESKQERLKRLDSFIAEYENKYKSRPKLSEEQLESMFRNQYREMRSGK
jgi:hypothetical protein